MKAKRVAALALQALVGVAWLALVLYGFALGAAMDAVERPGLPTVATACPPSSLCADTGGKVALSVYAKGHSAAQVLGIGTNGTDGAGGVNVNKCTLSSASTYTRCRLENLPAPTGACQ